MIKVNLYIVLVVLLVSCGISEDCFKGNSNSVTLTFPYENFTKIKVYTGVGLVIKEGPIYEVKVETKENIKGDIEVFLDGDFLVIKDNSTCNIARDYGVTTVSVTAPNIEEIHSKTDQDIRSDGVLKYGLLRLFSIRDDGDGAGTGNYFIILDSNGQFVVESNSFSNYYIEGKCKEMLLNFYNGEGRFEGEFFEADSIHLYHRGSNDMIVRPIEKIDGEILSTGNVLLKHLPNTIDVEQRFTGRLIY
ncbi:hypothetical protein GOQ30_15655 [Flavobacterium sp. TP390]|uniref:Putative auto-transporter adhesin head GIN domain-containing protein n=1 Tax=Flavobacterium profundi TaxID=1774945 RepID=A0A6I4IUK7_9FLAO|nr:DUF2807 domain-containing protein [Flavobacterium profundi]MVO10609.1 hypothetical protein [Flavobacterium profundi]